MLFVLVSIKVLGLLLWRMEKWYPDFVKEHGVSLVLLLMLLCLLVVVFVGGCVSLGQKPKETTGKLKLSPHGWSGQLQSWQN